MAAAAPVIAKAIVGTAAAGAVANKLAPDIPSPQPVAASETEPQKAANALADLRKKEARQLRNRRRSTILTSPSGDDSQLGVNRPTAGRGSSLLG